MKKIIALALSLASFTAATQAQKLVWFPEEVNPNDSLVIRIDLAQMDCQSLNGTAGPLYLWSWMPNEPVVTGGNGSWSASNTNAANQWFKRTDLSVGGADIWEFHMTPTVKDFYGCTAQKVYDNDIKFLVKEFDGGGGGDCSATGGENKTEDLTIAVTPAFIPPPKVFSFPSRMIAADATQTDTIFSNQDDVFRLSYNHNVGVETDSAALTWTGFNVWGKVTYTDATTSIPVSIPNLSSTPSTHMTDADGNGIFDWYIIPRQYFSVPAGKRIAKMSFFIFNDIPTPAILTDRVQYPANDFQFDYIFACP